jgi:SAM-dependent methyltransferase
MDLNFDQTVNWRREYDRKGIPSSFKSEPSGSLQNFMALLRERDCRKGKAIDIGAGTGRNSMYLASQGFDVVALELVPELVELLSSSSSTAGKTLPGRIEAHCHDVTTPPWPLASESCEVAVDAFCYKHQATEEAKRNYRQELARVVKLEGYYLLTLAGIDDGYYAQFLKESPDAERHVIVDPENEILSILYTREEIEREFSEYFVVVEYVHRRRRSMMHGAIYDRSTHMFIFQRRSRRLRGT